MLAGLWGYDGGGSRKHTFTFKYSTDLAPLRELGRHIWILALTTNYPRRGIAKERGANL